MSKKLVLFDAYGTLLDVYSVTDEAESAFPGQGKALALLWRDKQIEYTRLRALSQRYKHFWNITEDALDFACEALKLNLTSDVRQALLACYARLRAYPENVEVLQTLRRSGIRTAILSNGNIKMLDTAVSAADMTDWLDAVLSVEPLQTFKTDPRVYQYGLDYFGVEVKEALFVSSNCWDVCGATWFGLDTVWINRLGLPLERLDVVPVRQGNSLRAVLEQLNLS